MKLIIGANALTVYTNTKANVTRNKRLCTNCEIGEVETVCHFIMRCTFYAILREAIFDKIERTLSYSTYQSFVSLGENKKLYVMLGINGLSI